MKVKITSSSLAYCRGMCDAKLMQVMLSLNVWENYLNENFTLPLKAEISEYQDNGFLEPGDEIGVDSIMGNDGSYGV